jgi:peptide/nickel transport system permease protein
MVNYIIRRLAESVVIVILVSLIVFFMMRLIPGDPLQLFMSGTINLASMDPAKVAALRHEFGLDKPVILQYLSWLIGTIHGDFGVSLYYQVPVSGLIAKAFPITLQIGVSALVISIIIGILVGIVAALKRGNWLDTIVTSFTYLGQAVPIFWLGVLLVFIFNLKLRWLPTSGHVSPFEDLTENIRHIIMPVICLAITAIAVNARQMRSSMLEVIRQDYIRTAWSKGLRRRDIIFGHALKNSLIPVVTVIGFFVPWIFGGSVFIETVFGIPGVGKLLVDGITGKDFVVVQSVTLIIAVMVVVTNLLVDISYRWIDPRIEF